MGKQVTACKGPKGLLPRSPNGPGAASIARRRGAARGHQVVVHRVGCNVVPHRSSSVGGRRNLQLFWPADGHVRASSWKMDHPGRPPLSNCAHPASGRQSRAAVVQTWSLLPNDSAPRILAEDAAQHVDPRAGNRRSGGGHRGRSAGAIGGPRGLICAAAATSATMAGSCSCASTTRPRRAASGTAAAGLGARLSARRAEPDADSERGHLHRPAS